MYANKFMLNPRRTVQVFAYIINWASEQCHLFDYILSTHASTKYGDFYWYLWNNLRQ